MPDRGGPKWSIRGIAAGGAFLSLANLYYANDLIYTRKEGEAQEKRLDRMASSLKEIRTDVGTIRAQSERTAGNVEVIMNELKKKTNRFESHAKSTEEERDFWRNRYEEISNER